MGRTQIHRIRMIFVCFLTPEPPSPLTLSLLAKIIHYAIYVHHPLVSSEVLGEERGQLFWKASW